MLVVFPRELGRQLSSYEQGKGLLILLEDCILEPDRQVDDPDGLLLQGCIEELEEHVLSEISSLACEQGKGLLILLEEGGRV